MTTPRAYKIDLESTPYYHCVARCVRRSYLCGEDSVTGKNFNHRKDWLVTRFKTLSEVFAINISAYAVMSNHYHLVLHVNQDQAISWSNTEVKERWAALFPRDAKLLEDATPDFVTAKSSIWRERLASISWFMRCLNEKIAKLSNKEDAVTGRFWEGRFKSQALLDEGALLSAMAYVDLNPIRAGIAKTPETSEFTSIYERIKTASKSVNVKASLNATNSQKSSLEFTKAIDNAIQPQNLMPFKTKSSHQQSLPTLDFALSDYLELIDCTGRIFKAGKRGIIPAKMIPILDRQCLDQTHVTVHCEARHYLIDVMFQPLLIHN